METLKRKPAYGDPPPIPLRKRLGYQIVNHVTSIAALGLLLTGIVISVAGYIDSHDGFSLSTFVTDFYANVATELISIAITVLLIDTLNGIRAKRQEKIDLIRAMRSGDNTLAKDAVRELRIRGWLTDGTLRGLDFTYANLEEANLEGADLAEADFGRANLKNADLRNINLANARIWAATLEGANLEGAELTRIELSHGALGRAYYTRFSEETTLPDGSKFKHLPNPTNIIGRDLDQLGRFTDPRHPNFWRAWDRDSPAYQNTSNTKK